MRLQSLPSVDTKFKNKQGDTFMVIGRGTQGIIVEYSNGRVELLSTTKWNEMEPPQHRIAH